MSDSLQPNGLYSPWNSLGQKTGVGGLSFFWGIFPTQESQLVKNLPAVQETSVGFLGQATHSSILTLPLWLSC